MTFAERTGKEPFLNLYSDGLTQGSIATYLTCPTLFEQKYFHGYRLKKPFQEAMETGTIIHNALHAGYQAFGIDKAANVLDVSQKSISNSLLYYDAAIKKNVILGVESELDKCLHAHKLADIVCRNYFNNYPNDFNGTVNWVALEHPFTVQVTTRRGNVVPIRGKWDGIFDVNSSFRLFETKSKGRFTDDSLLKIVEYNLQVMVYLIAASMTFDRFVSQVVYNVVRRPLLRQGVKESDAEFYGRIEYDMLMRKTHYFSRIHASFAKEEIELYKKEVINIVSNIEDFYLTGCPLHKSLSSCVSFTGFQCDFTKLCYENLTNLYEKRTDTVYTELEINE